MIYFQMPRGRSHRLSLAAKKRMAVIRERKTFDSFPDAVPEILGT